MLSIIWFTVDTVYLSTVSSGMLGKSVSSAAATETKQAETSPRKRPTQSRLIEIAFDIFNVVGIFAFTNSFEIDGLVFPDVWCAGR